MILPIRQIIAEYAVEWKLKEWVDINKIYWDELSSNTNDGAISLLEANQDTINWWKLSSNSNDGAIRLLEANQDKIDWNWLSSQSFIFELNTNSILTRI